MNNKYFPELDESCVENVSLARMMQLVFPAKEDTVIHVVITNLYGREYATRYVTDGKAWGRYHVRHMDKGLEPVKAELARQVANLPVVSFEAKAKGIFKAEVLRLNDGE